MHSLKYTFFGLLIAVALFFLWALSLSGNLSVHQSRSYQIDQRVLFNEIANFNEWKDWFPWMDDSLSIETENPPLENGHRLSWSHPEQGKGYLEIVTIEPTSRIVMKMQFDESSEILLNEFKFIEKQTGEVEVSWTLYSDTKYPYPLGRVRAAVIRKMSKKNMEKALDDIPFYLSENE